MGGIFIWHKIIRASVICGINVKMSAPPVRVLCTDWPPPSDVSQLPAAAFLISTLWKPGQTVTIDFIDRRAEPWKKAWVEKVVTEMVQPYVNLNLKFGNYGRRADIRITFRHQNSAYSRLGTQSTWYKGSKEQPESMNLGWLDEPHSGTFRWKGRSYEFPGCTYCSKNTNGSVIIHEFGHALGMVHEHQNPTGGIQWNEQAVLNYYDKRFKRGWEYAVKAPTTRKMLQAIGRIVRNEEDRGVAVIMDYRARQFSEYIPGLRMSWDLGADVSEFFGI